MIDQNTPAQLRALALQIFNPNVQPNDAAHAGLGSHFDPAFFTGIRGNDPTINQQYYNLIAPLMLAIDGLTMTPNMLYTMNVTCALHGRPKHWYLQGLYEFKGDVTPPCSIGFGYDPLPGENGHYGDHGGWGFTIGTACCSGILNIWAEITEYWMAGNYPRAVTPFSG